MAPYARRKNCLVCESDALVQFLDLGAMPPANAFLTSEELQKPEERFPLTVSFCTDCALVQTQDVVDPAILFKDYVYMTSGSPPLVQHFVDLAEKLKKDFSLVKSDVVMEIGSNDGTFPAALKDDCTVVGIEPAHGLAEMSRKSGVQTEEVFFNAQVAETLREKYGKARIILAANVFAHLENLQDVCTGIELLLRDDGVFVMEAHWVGNLIGEGGFDQIYHEHLCYYSLTALITLFKRFNLHIVDVEYISTHGQSLRVYVRKGGDIKASVGTILASEKELGLDSLATFQLFSERVARNKEEIIETIRRLKAQGARIVGYGAPAKGNTLLNYCGIGTESIEYIGDATPLKHGRYSPGMHIPIVPVERIRADVPDYALLLAWNYAPQILEKEKELREKGTQFIIPVPQVRIV